MPAVRVPAPVRRLRAAGGGGPPPPVRGARVDPGRTPTRPALDGPGAGRAAEAPQARACIDIGSNTTRLLVAECERGRLNEVHQAREFTQIVDGKLADGSIAPHKIEEVAQVVSKHVHTAIELGAVNVRAVATAAIRRAPNG